MALVTSSNPAAAIPRRPRAAPAGRWWRLLRGELRVPATSGDERRAVVREQLAQRHGQRLPHARARNGLDDRLANRAHVLLGRCQYLVGDVGDPACRLLAERRRVAFEQHERGHDPGSGARGRSPPRRRARARSRSPAWRRVRRPGRRHRRLLVHVRGVWLGLSCGSGRAGRRRLCGRASRARSPRRSRQQPSAGAVETDDRLGPVLSCRGKRG